MLVCIAQEYLEKVDGAPRVVAGSEGPQIYLELMN